MVEIDCDVAAILRDIASNSDKTSGKILKKCERAARKGLSSIIVKTSEEDYIYLYSRNNDVYNIPVQIPPLIEKLESLGFKLSSDYNTDWLGNRIFIKISW